jgi:uncharacterized membrane protein YkvA (DUF1232 family)
MQTAKIDRQIEEAVRHERSTGTLAGLIRQYAQLHGVQPSAADVAGTVAFVEEYVRHAPAVLQALAAAAQQAGVHAEIAPVLTAAEEYFHAPLDVIPDHMGLLGLMDDAYLAHCLVQGASQRYGQRTGTPLVPLPSDMSQANHVIRGLIGEPLASQLDMGVAATLGMPAIQQALAQFPVLSDPLPMGPDPIWGNMSISERVDHPMGMLGIF